MYARNPLLRNSCKGFRRSGSRRTGLALRAPAHARAVAEELLDLALVAVRLPLALAQIAHPELLREALQGLARRVPERRAGGLELAVVHPTPETQLLGHLVRDP